jgi:hypothetical protein
VETRLTEKNPERSANAAQDFSEAEFFSLHTDGKLIKPLVPLIEVRF